MLFIADRSDNLACLLGSCMLWNLLLNRLETSNELIRDVGSSMINFLYIRLKSIQQFMFLLFSHMNSYARDSLIVISCCVSMQNFIRE